MTKTLLAAALLALMPGLTLAQASQAKTTAKTNTAAKASPAKTAAKPTAKKEVVAKAKPTSSRQQLHTAAVQVATGLIAAREALSPDELAMAKRVYVGKMACELGASVNVTSDPQAPGHFHLEGKGFRFHMAPVLTSTGAVRLEDPKAGAVWLQIANKSMLMDQKRGQRLADDCMSPEQVAVAETLKKAPAPNLLEPSPTK